MLKDLIRSQGSQEIRLSDTPQGTPPTEEQKRKIEAHFEKQFCILDSRHEEGEIDIHELMSARNTLNICMGVKLYPEQIILFKGKGK